MPGSRRLNPRQRAALWLIVAIELVFHLPVQRVRARETLPELPITMVIPMA